MSIISRLFCFCAILIVASCAQIVPLGGGKVDKQGPIAKVYAPENKSLNFNRKEIRIAFDEYLVLRDAANQLQVNPLLNEQAEINAGNKEIKIEFNEELKPNTTYHISWGNAVTDLHEGNPSENKEYVFSTGDRIDTFIIRGKVFSEERLNFKDVRINLYDSKNDSIVYLKKPLYSVKTDDQGNFSIPYIKEQEYYLVALEDKNKNYVYEQGEEKIGWGDKANTVQMFSEAPHKAFIKKVSEQGAGQVIVIFNREIKNPDLKDETGKSIYNSSISCDTLWIWNQWKDTLQHNLLVFEGSEIIDTLKINPADLKKWSRDEKANKLKPQIKSKINEYPFRKSVLITFQQPVNLKDAEKIILKDSSGAKQEIKFEKLMSEGQAMMGESEYFRNWRLNAEFNYSKKYKLEILPGALESYFKKENDSLVYEFKNAAAENYGTLILRLQLPEERNFLFELLNSNNEAVYNKSIEKEEKLSLIISGLSAGEYKMRLTNDSNDDKKYTNGDYLKKILPEKRIYFSQPIRVLADWEIEQDWNTLNDWIEK